MTSDPDSVGVGRLSARRFVLTLAIAGLAVASLCLLRNALVDTPLGQLPASVDGADSVHRGSWHFPRGGPYILATQCTEHCVLRVDRRRVVQGAGLQKRRMVFDAGVYEVELRRRGDGRLLWHPPGRRGPLEYVPASSLSQLAPESATFTKPGANIAEGVFALLIFVIVVAVIVQLLAGVYRRNDKARGQWFAMVAVFAVAVGWRLIGLGDAGQTWDEDVNWSAGRNYIQNLLALDFSDASWRWNLEHPPLMKYLMGVGAQFADGYGPARVVSAMCMALACALLLPICQRLGLGRTGLYAGLIAALTPHLIGHGQVVGHESIMAATWMLAILAALSVWPARDSRQALLRMALCGGAVGLALSGRFVNGLVGPLAWSIVVITAPSSRRWRTAWLGGLVMVAAAVVFFMALWPRMWTAPAAHLSEAWSVLKKSHAVEPFLGDMTNSPPLYYFAVYLLATAPLGVLIFGGAGTGVMLSKYRRSALVVALWLAFSMVVTLSPVRQDGVRYIIPCLFALALVAGVGVDAAGRWLVARWRRWWLAPAVIAGFCVYLALTAARVRPYFIDYYGEHVGGPDQVAATKRFEIAWWGEGLHQALAYLNEHAPHGARVYKRCIAPAHLAWMRGDLWRQEARRPQDADWAVVYAPSHRKCPLPASFVLAYEVEVQGAPLARVYRRN